MTIVLQLVDENITKISWIACLALTQQTDGTVSARLELDGIVPKGVVLDDHGIHASRVAFAPRATYRMGECHIPLEAAVLVRVLHGRGGIGMPDSYAAK